MENVRIDPDQFGYIVENLPIEELLCQLAEEASELSKAALKLRRALEGTNPTPVTPAEAMGNLREEIADVWLVLMTLRLDEDPVSGNSYQEMMARKTARWAGRMKEI